MIVIRNLFRLRDVFRLCILRLFGDFRVRSERAAGAHENGFAKAAGKVGGLARIELVVCSHELQ